MSCTPDTTGPEPGPGILKLTRAAN
ncbi:protein of unknown function [Rhodococcus sp. RD6.2]|nr:protein of unknown function [Rhodococcus sp. RD6.2]